MPLQSEVNAAIYLRLSRDDNTGNQESMSITNQRDFLVNYVKERGWKIFSIYVDDGYSGTNFERPDFKRMISDIEAGLVNCVITKDLSRLGRNYIQTGQYTDFFFPKHKVRYIAVNDNYDTVEEENDIAPFKNILNEMYAKDISKKVRTSRTTAARQGKFMGSKPPYGYVKSPDDKHRLIVDPPAAKVIERIFADYAGGYTARGIAEQLNGQEIDTPATYYFKQTGKRATRNSNQAWGSNTIMQLLKNQVYIGHMVQGQRQVTSFKTKQRHFNPESKWIVVENTHEPIISMATWEVVQARLKVIKATHTSHVRRNGQKEVSLFSGLLRCKDCGAGLHFCRDTQGDKVYEHYRCGTWVINGKEACSPHNTRVEVLEETILAEIRHYASLANHDEPALIDRILSSVDHSMTKELETAAQELRKKKDRMTHIDRAVMQLFEEKVAGNLPEAMFQKMIVKYEQEQQILEQQIEEMQAAVQCESERTSRVTDWTARVKQCLSVERLDRPLVVALVDKIVVAEAIKVDGVKRHNFDITYTF